MCNCSFFLNEKIILLPQSMLQYTPDLRISAEEAMRHPYFNDLPAHIRQSL
jgi:hypothetical protein